MGSGHDGRPLLFAGGLVRVAGEFTSNGWSRGAIFVSSNKTLKYNSNNHYSFLCSVRRYRPCSQNRLVIAYSRSVGSRRTADSCTHTASCGGLGWWFGRRHCDPFELAVVETVFA